MARIVSMVFGLIFLLVGIIGFGRPGFLGAHLSATHNVIHLVSGVLAVYFSAKPIGEVRSFCRVFGAVYLLLGLLGYILGRPGATTMPPMGFDAHLFNAIPGFLQFGTADHNLHLMLGAIFLIAAVSTRAPRGVTRAERAIERETVGK